ncbi:MAG: hypothetical protein KIT69_13220 [Propionibacteriaceae bacterium]|nr:hypothetical protein [Propionibacteriaceae bacterium]
MNVIPGDKYKQDECNNLITRLSISLNDDDFTLFTKSVDKLVNYKNLINNDFYHIVDFVVRKQTFEQYFEYILITLGDIFSGNRLDFIKCTYKKYDAIILKTCLINKKLKSNILNYSNDTNLDNDYYDNHLIDCLLHRYNGDKKYYDLLFSIPEFKHIIMINYKNNKYNPISDIYKYIKENEKKLNSSDINTNNNSKSTEENPSEIKKNTQEEFEKLIELFKKIINKNDYELFTESVDNLTDKLVNYKDMDDKPAYYTIIYYYIINKSKSDYFEYMLNKFMDNLSENFLKSIIIFTHINYDTVILKNCLKNEKLKSLILNYKCDNCDDNICNNSYYNNHFIRCLSREITGNKSYYDLLFSITEFKEFIMKIYKNNKINSRTEIYKYVKEKYQTDIINNIRERIEISIDDDNIKLIINKLNVTDKYLIEY